MPAPVDTTVEHAAPELCGCGGAVVATGTSQRIVVDDVPVVRPERTAHVVYEGTCCQCGKTVRARVAGLPEQDGTVSHAVLGPRAATLAVSLRFEQHMPLQRVAAVLRQTTGLSVSAGALCRHLVHDLESDFFRVYTRRADLLHAYCGAHLLREAKPSSRGAGRPVGRLVRPRPAPCVSTKARDAQSAGTKTGSSGCEKASGFSPRWIAMRKAKR